MKLQTIEAQEFRFRQIIRLSEKNYSQTQIAELLQCSQSWVSRILQRAEQADGAALRAKRSG